MKWLKKLLKNKIKEGGGITFYSTGKPFNPAFQERTTPNEDFRKEDEVFSQEALDKMFGIIPKLNHTDKRILKLLDKRLSIEQVARKIGRPDDIQRVKDAIKREHEIKWRRSYGYKEGEEDESEE